MPQLIVFHVFTGRTTYYEFVILTIIFLINKDKIATCSKQTCSIFEFRKNEQLALLVVECYFFLALNFYYCILTELNQYWISDSLKLLSIRLLLLKLNLFN